jgi:hypothetical protein
MRSIIFVIAVLGEALTVGQATAQDGLGSISGRVIATQEGRPVDLFGNSLFVAPAGIPQPYVGGSIADSLTPLDRNGNFHEAGLPAGDYYIFPDRALAGRGTFEGLPDTVTIRFSELEPVETFPALRVSLAAGEDLTGIQIFLEIPAQCFGELCPLSFPLSPVRSPDSGSGSDSGDAAYLGAAIAGAAVVLLGGGIAMRVQQRRRSA